MREAISAGAPEADKLIALLRPPLIAALMLEFPCPPCWIVSDAGDAESVKLACDCTVRIRVFHCVWWALSFTISRKGNDPTCDVVPVIAEDPFMIASPWGNPP
ncbi:MAG: hypothetical protein WA655_01885 [Candidatus Korobacteraceae bacterium]